MAFKDYFSDVAQEYKNYRPDYPPELFVYLASLCAEHQLVWDCATGTGQAAKALANYFDHVFATDASEAQIKQAVPDAKITYVCEPAETTSLKDHSVDLITVAQALHWFDLPKFYAEVKRVLKPQGILAAWCYQTIATNHKAIHDLVDQLYWDITRQYWSKERDYIDQAYQNIAFPFEKLKTPAFQIQKSWNCDQLLGYIGTWSGLRNYMHAGEAQHQKTEEVFIAIENAWPKDRVEIDFHWPIKLLAARI
ncbi:MAG: putative methyltransferase [Gammaproteobacteria bacterium]|jgi:ubiquinone/menaquinone biosynthesis C-methylase UbiE|nr:putative methyltransferase [Gammaproteobacteria bacterium]